MSPNPSEASSDSHRSQLSTPPLLTPTFQRDPLTSSPMPPHHGQIYQMGLPQGHGNSFGRQNQGNDNNFSNQQHFGGPPTWGGVLSANLSSQSNIQRPLLQQNPMINTSVNFKAQSNVSGPSPQNILQQLQSSKNQSEMSAGIFSRPSMEGFHQLGGPVPPRPSLDIPSRMREPGPRMLEMMGMIPSLPGFGHTEGLSSACRMRPPGTEAMGLDSSHMNQAPFRGQQEQQEMDKNGSQGKMNPAPLSVFTSSAMNSHPYGMECRQSVSGTNGSAMSGPVRSAFGDNDVGPSRGPGLGWGVGQNEGKTFPVNHPPPPPPPPPTLANLLQQHGHVDMRLGLPGDHGTEQLNPGLARLSAGHSVHTSAMSPHSPPSIGSLGAVHLGMLPMPSSQPSRPAPHSQLPRGQHFMQEVKTCCHDITDTKVFT